MSLHSNPNQIAPVAYGHEHETAHMVGDERRQAETEAFPSHISLCMPKHLRGHNQFLLNGFRVYPGHNTIVEVATPECADPDELTVYRRAGRDLLDTLFSTYLESVSSRDHGREVHGRIQDRVVDSQGSRKASHISVGLNGLDEHPVASRVITSHQATRSFVTGAGLVSPDGLRFAQKIDGLSSVDGYGYTGTMFRYTDDEGTTRLEDRSGDINISDWASWQHAGSFALAVIAARTPLARELPLLANNDEIMEQATQLNGLELTPEGQLIRNKLSFVSVDFQQQLAELIMKKATAYMDELPGSLNEVASELYSYCEEYRQFVKGEVTLHEFAEYIDWAAKFKIVLASLQRDTPDDDTPHDDDAPPEAKRTMLDQKSRAIDLRYDYQGFVARDGEMQTRTDGLGRTLRNQGKLSERTTPEQRKHAQQHPPTSTRAHLRADLLRQYNATVADWSTITITDGEHSAKIDIKDVTQTDFTSDNHSKMSRVQKRA